MRRCLRLACHRLGLDGLYTSSLGSCTGRNDMPAMDPHMRQNARERTLAEGWREGDGILGWSPAASDNPSVDALRRTMEKATCTL